MDWDNTKVEISWSGDNIGCKMTEGEKILDWGELSRDEQMHILSGIAGMYDLFYRFLKEN